MSWEHVRLGVCARRSAPGSSGTKATSLGTGVDRAAWRIPSPHAPPIHIKALEGIE